MSKHDEVTTYKGDELRFYEDRVCDRFGCINVDDMPDPQPDCPVRLKEVTPILERMWRIAFWDIESNILETEKGRYFGGGAKFGPKVYTRDISYSGVLGLNEFYPQVMRDSLEVTRKVRWDTGFTVSRGHAVPEIDVPWEELDIPEAEFTSRFTTNNYSRRTDDVVWLWAASDLFTRQNAPAADWRWLYETGQKFFKRFYAPFYDPSDGLYRGQVSFVDVRWPHKESAGGYPSHFTVKDCLMLKASTTNALYLKGLSVMAEAAEKIGLKGESEDWADRAAKLRESIQKHLVASEGYIVCYKDRHGKKSHHTDALGTALCILHGAVEKETAEFSAKHYPTSEIGIPLFNPFFKHNKMYHNYAAWPFVDAFFLSAKETALQKSQCAYNFALLARTVREDGFHEVVDMRSGEVGGSGHQLWSAAACLNACRRAGLQKE